MDQFKPEEWEKFVGQHRLKEQLQIMIKSALIRGQRLDHILLIGPPGSGKTSIAKLIAQQLSDPFHSVVVSSNFKMRDLARIFRRHHGVLLLDEVHRLSKATQEDLLPVLEDGFLETNRVRIHLHPSMTIIGATTEPDQITAALFERFVIPPFDPYSDDEMTVIVHNMAEKVNLPLNSEVGTVFGRASAGSPRQAKRIISMARDLYAVDSNIIQFPDLVLKYCALTPEGLSEHHLIYLEILANSSSGTVGLSVIASMMRFGKEYIMELERTLLRLNLIEHTPRGRCLLPDGDFILERERGTHAT